MKRNISKVLGHTDVLPPYILLSLSSSYDTIISTILFLSLLLSLLYYIYTIVIDNINIIIVAIISIIISI